MIQKISPIIKWKKKISNSPKERKEPTSAFGEHGQEFFLQWKAKIADGKCSARNGAARTLFHGRFRFQTLDFVHGRLSLLTCKWYRIRMNCQLLTSVNNLLATSRSRSPSTCSVEPENSAVARQRLRAWLAWPITFCWTLIWNEKMLHLGFIQRWEWSGTSSCRFRIWCWKGISWLSSQRLPSLMGTLRTSGLRTTCFDGVAASFTDNETRHELSFQQICPARRHLLAAACGTSWRNGKAEQHSRRPPVWAAALAPKIPSSTALAESFRSG